MMRTRVMDRLHAYCYYLEALVSYGHNRERGNRSRFRLFETD